MTLLVASIAEESLDAIRQRAAEAFTSGADAVEIRIDSYAGDAAELASFLKEHSQRTYIVTSRSCNEGGFDERPADRRAAALAAVSADTNVYIDFELTDWMQCQDIHETLGIASAPTEGNSHRLILSTHDFSGVPAELAATATRMINIPDVAAGKVAYSPADINDSFPALDLLYEHGQRLAAICMDYCGLWSRVLAKKLGGFASYCALDKASTTAPGQLTLDETIQLYRWPAIDSSTKVFGVVGDPVKHSMSPVLFNRWFADAKVNAVYLPLQVTGSRSAVERFLRGCVARPWLDVTGLSVTLPHKTAALEWVGQGADYRARTIGATNTVVFRKGQATCHNTDWYAAVDSLAGALGCSRTDLSRVSVDVLGTGGAAKAVVAGLRDVGAQVTVFGRAADRTRRLAEQFDCRAEEWATRAQRRGEVLINCTNVGMWPDVDEAPMPPDTLEGCRLVFDLIYNPLETRLLRQAAATGAGTLSGLEMFIRQAAAQFELWTSKRPDVRTARELIRRAIQPHVENEP
ncbi:MAG: type I 3-dehydroquinate dehydratase [Phycisphaerales bacterium]|nr:MAG: type I 3-dehydroquinate dehydratase [Phycisphaerales bacterium]